MEKNIDHKVETKETQELSEQKTQIQNDFELFFSQQGLRKEMPVSLISGAVDSTVLFIGSSTNVFKKYLKEKGEVPECGVSLWQKKLRTQNYESLFDNEKPEYCSYFTGCGILMPAEKHDETCEMVLNFLTTKLDINIGDLLIDLSSEDTDMLKYWQSKRASGINIRSDNHQINDYRWQFGEKDLTGRGIGISIKNNQDDTFGEFSTLEIIERNGMPIGIEWGFGLETFLCKKLGLNHPIAIATVSEIFKQASDDKYIKLADSLTAAMAILNEGITTNKKKSGVTSTILRRFLQGVVYHSRENGIKEEQLMEWVKYLKEKEFSQISDTEEGLMDFIRGARLREDKLSTAIINALNGDLRELKKMSGVNKLLRDNSPINVFVLADIYAYIGFKQSSLFKRISKHIDASGNLII